MTIGWPEHEASFRESLAELVDLLVVEETLPAVLQRVVGLACSGIGECDLASVTAMKEREFETIVYTDPVAEAIDQVQYAADSGPCVYAFRRSEPASVPSMADG